MENKLNPSTNTIMKSVLTTVLAVLLIVSHTFAQQGGQQCFALSYPATLDVDCAGTTGAVANWTVTATPLCGQSVTVTCVPPSGSTFQLGVTTVNCTAADNLGNTKQFTITVNVQRDRTPPELKLPEPMMVQCAGADGAVVNFTVGTTDNCSQPVQVTTFPSSGSKFPIGTNWVNCMAVDWSGNATTGVFPIVVSAACPTCVSFLCPRVPLTASAGPKGTAAVDYELFATNRCDSSPVKLVCVPSSGSDFPVGTNDVDCASYLGDFEVQRCQFKVVVRDELPPVIKVPATMSVACSGWSTQTGQAGRAVNFTVTATDNVDAYPQIVCLPPSGSFFPIGTNTIACTATDNFGNTSSKSFAIVVKSGPACEVAAPDPDYFNPPDNWSFENGLTGWERSGDAFENQPTFRDNVTVRRIGPLKEQIEDKIGGDYWRDLSYPIGHQGRFWIGTAENHPDDLNPLGTMIGEGVKGWLRSKVFTIETKYISFLIGGHADLSKLRVELLVETPVVTPSAEQIGARWYEMAFTDTGHGEETLRRDLWTVQSHMGKRARIRIIDNS